MGKKKAWQDWGLRFRVQCRQKDISTGDVAERVGLAESTVRSWLNGTREVNLSDFFHICEAAGIDPATTLFAGQVDPRFLEVGQAWAETTEGGKQLLLAASDAARRLGGAQAESGYRPNPPRS